MEYRRLGNAGIKVSALSLGSWVTYGKQVDIDAAAASLKTAYDAGVNFFDNAEAYAGGESERIMGAALRKLGLRRGSYLVSTKIYWGLHEGPNEKNTLNRKRLLEAIDGSLERFGLDHVDLLYCHRADKDTPVEETVYAMSDIIASGKALYWGTSEWSAEEIREAWEIADRRNLRKPQMEQPQYNLFVRERVEGEYARLYGGVGLGLTTFSPLASGVLTGKYDAGLPADSRLALPGYEWLKEAAISPARIAATRALEPIARELGATRAQLGIAWCAKNPRVSSVITGASRPAQVAENMKAMELVAKLDEGLMRRIEEATRGASDRKVAG
ncbi:MAG: aldo/keto reductase [Spirochaetaceae bacterium]|nr:aldo/keto reductase [Spirochaetaceae bacterium]